VCRGGQHAEELAEGSARIRAPVGFVGRVVAVVDFVRRVVAMVAMGSGVPVVDIPVREAMTDVRRRCVRLRCLLACRSPPGGAVHRCVAPRYLVQAEADPDPLSGADEHQEKGGQRGR